MTKRIDAHHHVWDLAVRDQPWMTGEPMAPIVASFGIDEFIGASHDCGVVASVVVQTVTEVDETEELLDLAARTASVAGVVGWVDVAAADVGDQLDRLQSRSDGRWLVGIRSLVQYEPDPNWLQRPAVVAGLGEVARRGLVNELLALPHQLPAMTAAVRASPDIRFVLDHLAKPPIAKAQWEPWASDMVDLAHCGNVVAKFSGLVTEAVWSDWSTADIRRYVDHAVAAFGSDRLLFGSDWPVCTLAASYERIVELADELVSDLSAAERDAIFRGNATATYGLDPTLQETTT